jgi:hypothetical protein
MMSIETTFALADMLQNQIGPDNRISFLSNAPAFNLDYALIIEGDGSFRLLVKDPAQVIIDRRFRSLGRAQAAVRRIFPPVKRAFPKLQWSDLFYPDRSFLVQLAVAIQGFRHRFGLHWPTAYLLLSSLLKREEVRQVMGGVEGGFRTIMADPHWRRYSGAGRGAVKPRRRFKRATMSLEEISALPISQLAAADSHLYLWVPLGLIEDGLEVMRAWGFEYKTILVSYKVARTAGVGAAISAM